MNNNTPDLLPLFHQNPALKSCLEEKQNPTQIANISSLRCCSCCVCERKEVEIEPPSSLAAAERSDRPPQRRPSGHPSAGLSSPFFSRDCGGIKSKALPSMESNNHNPSSFSTSARSSRSGDGVRGKGFEIRDDRQRSGGRGRGRGGGGGTDKIDALGRLLTRILRHMASELKLNMRSDGYVRVSDILKLNMKTLANIPLSSHTVDEIKEAVRKDNKQRFGLLEENGELLIRANQGHTIATIESESLLRPIISAEEAPVCVHGTYRRNLESILKSGLKRMKRLHVHFSCGLPTDGEVISGMRGDVNVLIFLDVRKALEDGLKLYISENRVILTEGIEGVVPVKYFEKIEAWPSRQPISF